MAPTRPRTIPSWEPLIVVEPRRTELAQYKAVHLPIRPGTNVALLNARACVLVEEYLVEQTTERYLGTKQRLVHAP